MRREMRQFLREVRHSASYCHSSTQCIPGSSQRVHLSHVARVQRDRGGPVYLTRYTCNGHVTPCVLQVSAAGARGMGMGRGVYTRCMVFVSRLVYVFVFGWHCAKARHSQVPELHVLLQHGSVGRRAGRALGLLLRHSLVGTRHACTASNTQKHHIGSLRTMRCLRGLRDARSRRMRCASQLPLGRACDSSLGRDLALALCFAALHSATHQGCECAAPGQLGADGGPCQAHREWRQAAPLSAAQQRPRAPRFHPSTYSASIGREGSQC